MRSLNLKYLEAIRLNSRQASSLKAIGEFKGKQALFARQTPQLLDSLRKVAQIESAESSNRIEGVVAPRARVEALVENETKPRDRSEQEIAGYRDVLARIHESARHMALTMPSVLQMHAMLYRYLPTGGGEWKRADNHIVERNADGSLKEVRFEPVSAADTPAAMDEFVRNYAKAIRLDHLEPMIIIPLAVLDFLCIHPFHDGNGRMSRLLVLMLLYHFDYEVGRYISLERIVEESKGTYYETLKESSQGWHQGEHDPHPWLNYFWGVLVRAYKEFEQRVGEIRDKKMSKSEQIRLAVDRRVGPFAISDIEKDCPHISRDMIRNIIRELRDEGAISVEGIGRGAKWVRSVEETATGD
jgi:Fic family protein